VATLLICERPAGGKKGERIGGVKVWARSGSLTGRASSLVTAVRPVKRDWGDRKKKTDRERKRYGYTPLS